MLITEMKSCLEMKVQKNNLHTKQGPLKTTNLSRVLAMAAARDMAMAPNT